MPLFQILSLFLDFVIKIEVLYFSDKCYTILSLCKENYFVYINEKDLLMCLII